MSAAPILSLHSGTPSQPTDDECALLANSEAGNAARLVELHGFRIRYVPKWDAWLVWNSECWRRDDRDVLVTELAKDVGRSWVREAADAITDKARDALISWGRQSLSTRGI